MVKPLSLAIGFHAQCHRNRGQSDHWRLLRSQSQRGLTRQAINALLRILGDAPVSSIGSRFGSATGIRSRLLRARGCIAEMELAQWLHAVSIDFPREFLTSVQPIGWSLFGFEDGVNARAAQEYQVPLRLPCVGKHRRPPLQFPLQRWLGSQTTKLAQR